MCPGYSPPAGAGVGQLSVPQLPLSSPFPWQVAAPGRPNSIPSLNLSCSSARQSRCLVLCPPPQVAEHGDQSPHGVQERQGPELQPASSLPSPPPQSWSVRPKNLGRAWFHYHNYHDTLWKVARMWPKTHTPDPSVSQWSDVSDLSGFFGTSLESSTD